MRAEVPGPQKGKLVPRLRESSIILYAIYLGLTVILATALLFTGMRLYDSVITSFSTAGTGGFSVMNSSIMGYNNPAAEWIIAIFMILFGVNFNLYFFLLIKRWKNVLKNEELRAYFAIIIASVTVITVNLYTSMRQSFDSIWHCIRAAFFQVASIMSTTGFVSMDFELWPNLSKTVLLMLMLVGASAGSTAGGIKVSRLVIILKTLRLRIKKMLKPNAVIPLRLDGEPIPSTTGNTAVNYLALYSVIMAAVMLLISIDGKDILTTVTATVTCLNNVGPGLGNIVGPMYNFSTFSDFSKIILSFTMLFGRLELIPMIIILSPSTYRHWRKNKLRSPKNSVGAEGTK
jgi:trk system potassium uptake protein TrkH